MPSRRRLPSISSKMVLRDSPPMLGARRAPKRTLVATTISSRRAKSRSARPTISSDVPSE
jgi:hypothetical protein